MYDRTLYTEQTPYRMTNDIQYSILFQYLLFIGEETEKNRDEKRKYPIVTLTPNIIL